MLDNNSIETKTINNDSNQKKGNKGIFILTLLIIILLVIIGYNYYTHYCEKIKKEDGIIKEKIRQIDEEAKNLERKNRNNKTQNYSDESYNSIKTTDKKTGSYNEINYEIKEENNSYCLYVNGKETYICVENLDNNKIYLDIKPFKDVILVEDTSPTLFIRSMPLYVVDKNANRKRLYDVANNKYGNSYLDSYRIEGNSVYLHAKTKIDKNKYCYYTSLDVVESYEIEYKYLGNSEFSDGTVLNEETFANNYTEKKCQDVIAFNDLSTNKLCKRDNGEITCYDIENYKKTKQNLIDIFGESACTSNMYTETLTCQKANSRCYLYKNTSVPLCEEVYSNWNM